MSKPETIQWKPLILSLLISLGTGALSGFLTRNNVGIYETLKKPPLSPPALVFPIVWTILFALMGLSAYRIDRTKSKHRKSALILYAVQLIVNFAWSLIFFNLNLWFFSFLWLLLLWGLIRAMIHQFSKIDKTAAYLQIPYLLWVTFAGYLNLSVYLLNQ